MLKRTVKAFLKALTVKLPRKHFNLRSVRCSAFFIFPDFLVSTAFIKVNSGNFGNFVPACFSARNVSYKKLKFSLAKSLILKTVQGCRNLALCLTNRD